MTSSSQSSVEDLESTIIATTSINIEIPVTRFKLLIVAIRIYYSESFCYQPSLYSVKPKLNKANKLSGKQEVGKQI